MLVERIGAAQLAEWVAAGTSLAGSVLPGTLPRVGAALAEGAAGRLEVSLHFRAGPESFPVVEIRATGMLPLVCQRCLRAVPWSLDLDVVLTLVPDEAAAEELADPFDSVLLENDGALALRAMVEDEILAMMPLAPLHAQLDGCRLSGGDEASEAATSGAASKVNRPFAGLGTLMGEDGKGGK